MATFISLQWALLLPIPATSLWTIAPLHGGSRLCTPSGFSSHTSGYPIHARPNAFQSNRLYWPTHPFAGMIRGRMSNCSELCQITKACVSCGIEPWPCVSKRLGSTASSPSMPGKCRRRITGGMSLLQRLCGPTSVSSVHLMVCHAINLPRWCWRDATVWICEAGSSYQALGTARLDATMMWARRCIMGLLFGSWLLGPFWKQGRLTAPSPRWPEASGIHNSPSHACRWATVDNPHLLIPSFYFSKP
jgi:hypothetical protein